MLWRRTRRPAAGLRYPDEFDGIAGDPANIRRNSWALELAVQTFKDPEAYIPPAKYPMIIAQFSRPEMRRTD